MTEEKVLGLSSADFKKLQTVARAHDEVTTAKARLDAEQAGLEMLVSRALSTTKVTAKMIAYRCETTPAVVYRWRANANKNSQQF